MSPAILPADVALTPYWWVGAGAPPAEPVALPQAADVVVIGSGYTGLHAALQTARAGRSTVVVDAEALGWGCSSRNGGQISTSIKPGLATLERRYGRARAQDIVAEGRRSLAWTGAFIAAEGIECDFRVCGKFHGAHTAAAYARLARLHGSGPEVEAGAVRLVPRAGQRAEIGSDAYHGGVVFARHAALDPARYHRGLLARVQAAGAVTVPHCPVLDMERQPAGWHLRTPAGEIRTEAVVVATNGYTGTATPWLRRRVIPIGSYIIATEPLPEETMARLMPKLRIVTDTRKVVYYYRPSPDGRRIVFGGRVSHGETDPRTSALRLHAAMVGVFPELARTPISHSWSGLVAYSFDELPHIGNRDGIHYAMGYCGSGVGMAGYLGMRLGRQVLGERDGATGFDGLSFPTRPFYTGRPWFLPLAVGYYRLRDALGR